MEGNDLAVAPERCVGCGTCATVCPTAALESKKPDDKELLRAAVAAMQANDGAAVIMDAAMQAAAEGKYDPAKVVVVKSLGRVDESLIAVLAAGGATSVALVAGPVEGSVADARRRRRSDGGERCLRPPEAPTLRTRCPIAWPILCATPPCCCWKPGGATCR